MRRTSVTILLRGVSSERLFGGSYGIHQDWRLVAWFAMGKGLVLDALLDVQIRIEFLVVFVAHVRSLARRVLASSDRIQFAVGPFADGRQNVPGGRMRDLQVEHVLVIILASLLVQSGLHLVLFDLELPGLLSEFSLVFFGHFLPAHPEGVTGQDVDSRGVVSLNLGMLIGVVTRKPRPHLVELIR